MQVITTQARNLAKHWLSVSFSLLGLAGLAVFIAGYASELEHLRQLSLPRVLLLALLALLVYGLVAVKFQLSVTMFGVRLSLSEAFMLVMAGGLFTIVPLSGVGLRALYLKRVHGLKYVNFGMGMVANLFTGFVANGLLGLLGLWILAGQGEAKTSPLLLILFWGYILGPVAAFCLGLWLKRKGNGRLLGHSSENVKMSWWAKIYRSVLDGVEVMLRQPQAVGFFLILNLSINQVTALIFWLTGLWLGYPVNFAAGMVLWAVSQLTAIATIVPSDTIGLNEAVTGLGTLALGGSTISGVIIAAIFRVVSVVWILLFGTISLFFLRAKITQAERVAAPVMQTSPPG